MDDCARGAGGGVEARVYYYGEGGGDSGGEGERKEWEGFAEEVGEQVQPWGDEKGGEGDAGKGAEGEEGAEKGGGYDRGAVLKGS